MALKLSVKIGDVTNLSDARYAAGMGVDYIGFNIDSASENFVTPKTFKEIINWISGVGIIGEIGDKATESTSDYPPYLLETSNPDLLGVNPEAVYKIAGQGLSTGTIEEHFNTNKNVLFYVLEVTNKQLEDNLPDFANLCATYPIYLSTNFTELLLEKTISIIKPKGIEIKGGLEDQPGFKDYDGIADVLEWLEEDD